MSAISHGSPGELPKRGRLSISVSVPEMWASLAIIAMWLAVLCDAIWGPDFVSTSSGGDFTKIPSAIVIAIFAYLGTRVLARYGFGNGERLKKD